MTSWVAAAANYFRIVRGVHELARTPLPLDWDERFRRQLESRESVFLDSVRRAVFDSPANPYLEMFRSAGCAYADLEQSVRDSGLEKTLESLRAAGVWLSNDEFKGKIPILRAGRQIPASTASFLNPLARGWLEASSGGSRSRGTVTRNSVDHHIQREGYVALYVREHDLSGRLMVHVRPILPAAAGVEETLHYARVGVATDRWFSPGRGSLHYRLMTSFLVGAERAFGIGVPFPKFLPPDDFTPAAEWVARRKRQGLRCMVGGYASHDTRVAAAALDEGFDIGGTFFLSGGEPLTPAKCRLIERAGAEVSSRYFIVEIGPVGFGCRHMKSKNQVHLFEDSVAVIVYRRSAPLSETEVNSLLFTTLRPTPPYFLINAEVDDCGTVGTARCDCVFSQLGFRTVLSDIHSFGKLTGSGMTLVGSEMARIVEEVLPERFGGTPCDYQLVECDRARQTHLVLRINPRISIASTEEVRKCLLAEMPRLYGGALASRTWRNDGSLEVVRAEPVPTLTGKHLPLHLLRLDTGGHDEP